MSDLTPFDWSRILYGDMPLWLLGEMAMRAMVMYAFALLLVRSMGKRSTRQMSPFDFVIIIALGSAVGDPMLYPEVPLLHGMVVIGVVIALEQLGVFSTQRSETADRFMSGVVTPIVEDGRLLVDEVRAQRMDVHATHALLRAAGVEHLGAVRVAYMEQSGELSVFEFDEPRPGLPLVPPPAIAEPLARTGEDAPRGVSLACGSCGQVVEAGGGTVPPCPNDAATSFFEATVPIRQN